MLTLLTRHTLIPESHKKLSERVFPVLRRVKISELASLFQEVEPENHKYATRN